MTDQPIDLDALVAETLDVEIPTIEPRQQPVASKTETQAALKQWLHEREMRRLMRPGD
ncbi:MULTISPECIES: hypothetical protein [unclassified Luteococcus]|uniref:hypothetical protein n=1 Tax=unclassified Luteococcus TaxID=2639923 RepID=UPI00313C71AB